MYFYTWFSFFPFFCLFSWKFLFFFITKTKHAKLFRWKKNSVRNNCSAISWPELWNSFQKCLCQSQKREANDVYEEKNAYYVIENWSIIEFYAFHHQGYAQGYASYTSSIFSKHTSLLKFIDLYFLCIFQ